MIDIVPTKLPGVLIVESRLFGDERGFFREIFRDEHFRTAGLPVGFRQDNHSRSRRGVLRGLHFQLNRPQGKMVTVIRGQIYDVVVDIRRGSPTFASWVGVTLRDDEPRSVWVPPGYAHGFCVTSDIADVVYKCTDVYVPDDERGVHWADTRIGIEWPVDAPVLSAKDHGYAGLDEDRSDLPIYRS